MDQDQIAIITVNDRNWAEIEEPAGAAVGEDINAHERSEEGDSGSPPSNLNYTSGSREVREVRQIKMLLNAKFELSWTETKT
jgi:hypothetical protein